MSRILITVLLPLLTPFVVFALYQWYERYRGALPEEQRRTPWEWLAVAGVGLAALVFVLILVLGDGGGRESTYVPPRWDGERVVPGYFER